MCITILSYICGLSRVFTGSLVYIYGLDSEAGLVQAQVDERFLEPLHAVISPGDACGVMDHQATPYTLHPLSLYFAISLSHSHAHTHTHTHTLTHSLTHYMFPGDACGIMDHQATPYTSHPTPHTLHPTPYTLHSTPYTLHPTPYTLNPTP